MLICALLACLSATALSADETELTLVRDGQSAYTIIVPDEALPVERYAAGELRDLLQEMSGVALPVTTEAEHGAQGGPGIYLGDTRKLASLPAERRQKLGADGVHLLSEGADLYLTGEGLRGRLYSVYVLCEKVLGVRFLAHDCTVVPRREVITLPALDYAYTPPMMYRETLYFDSFGKQISARQRLNGPMCEADEETGGKIELFPYVHSAAQLVPPEEFYEQHPEYFSLVNGKRTRETIHGQLCFTNPEVLKIATERVLQWMADRPEVPIIDVSQNDGGGACECEACAAVVAEEGSQHGPILRFVNAIADVVAQRYPDRWIETLAYAYSITPPRITRPRENVIIRLCHAGCYNHGFEACDLGAGLAGVLRGWSELTDRIFIWHYATNFAHYLAPNPNLEGLAKDIRFYAAHNVNGLMVQANYQGSGGELCELRQYLAARLMWDPQQDEKVIRREFCTGYYGAAAKEVLEFLELMDELGRDPERHSFGAWDPGGAVPPQFVEEGLEVLERARAAATEPQSRTRVNRLMLPLWYMQLSWPDRYGLSPDRAPSVVEEARHVIENHGITHVAEGGPNAAGWLESMRVRFEPVPANAVIDLLALKDAAKVVNCLDWRSDSIEEDGHRRACLFQHPPAEGDGDATYELDLPHVAEGEGLILRFATGFTGPTANGARFSVLVDGENLLSTQQAEEPPVRHEVDLTPYAGRKVSLTLRVNALGNTDNDWAVWVRPLLLRE